MSFHDVHASSIHCLDDTHPTFVVKFVYLLKFKYDISELLEVSLFFGFIAEEPGSAFK